MTERTMRYARALLEDYASTDPADGDYGYATHENISPELVSTVRAILDECDYLLDRGVWSINIGRLQSLIERNLREDKD